MCSLLDVWGVYDDTWMQIYNPTRAEQTISFLLANHDYCLVYHYWWWQCVPVGLMMRYNCFLPLVMWVRFSQHLLSCKRRLERVHAFMAISQFLHICCYLAMSMSGLHDKVKLPKCMQGARLCCCQAKFQSKGQVQNWYQKNPTQTVVWFLRDTHLPKLIPIFTW